MKKLNKIIFILLLSCNTTQAGFFSDIWNKVVETVKEVKDKASDFLFGQQDDDRGLITTITTPFLNLTIRNLRIKRTENLPYTKESSQILKGELSTQEKNLIDKRKITTNKAIKSLLNINDDNEEKTKYPNIGLAFSGGGYRAMIGTLGFLKGLEETKILETVLYNAGLSGSTWAIAGWLASNKSLDDYVTDLKNSIKNNIKLGSKGIIRIPKTSELSKIAENLTTKFIFNQPINIVDVYGSIIVSNILNGIENNQEIRLSDQRKKIENEDLFLPIYTAISPYNESREFNWFEVNPYVVRNLSNNFYTKIEDFGRKYKDGQSINNIGPNLEKVYPPELPLGSFLGIFGSAFSFNIKDVSRIMTNENTNPIQAYVLINLFAKGPSITEGRGSSYKAFNPTYKYKETINNDIEEIDLIDSGIDFNLPLPALLNKEKSIDIAIAFDLSKNYLKAGALKSAYATARKNKLNFPDINSIQNPGEEEISIFEGEPTIIYLPFKNNCIDTFCGTSNFAYSEDEFDYVFNTAKSIAIKNSGIIKEVIKSHIKENTL